MDSRCPGLDTCNRHAGSCQANEPWRGDPRVGVLILGSCCTDVFHPMRDGVQDVTNQGDGMQNGSDEVELIPVTCDPQPEKLHWQNHPSDNV